MADINQVQLPDGSQYNITDTTSGYATQSDVQSAISGITKATIGLGNVDNTSDANKPVSTAQQTALDGKTNTSVIAYTESSATATKRYEIGDQFILSGVLYTTTTIIPNGDPITIGTNCVASDTIIEQIPNVEGKANKTDLTSISETGSTASQAISAGTYFYLNGTLVKAKTAIASGATFTLNTNYEVVSVGALNDNEIYTLTPSSIQLKRYGNLCILTLNNYSRATAVSTDTKICDLPVTTSLKVFGVGKTLSNVDVLLFVSGAGLYVSGISGLPANVQTYGTLLFPI